MYHAGLIFTLLVIVVIAVVTFQFASSSFEKPKKIIKESKTFLPLYRESYEGPYYKISEKLSQDLAQYGKSVPDNYKCKTTIKLTVNSWDAKNNLKALGWTWTGSDKNSDFATATIIDNIHFVEVANNFGQYFNSSLVKELHRKKLACKLELKSEVLNPPINKALDDEVAMISARMEVDKSFAEAMNAKGIFLKSENESAV